MLITIDEHCWYLSLLTDRTLTKCTKKDFIDVHLLFFRVNNGCFPFIYCEYLSFLTVQAMTQAQAKICPQLNLIYFIIIIFLNKAGHGCSF